MKPEMSSEKSPSEMYTIDNGSISSIAVVETKKSSRLTKKHVLIAIASLIAVGLVIACVLVAIHIHGDTQKEIALMAFKDTYNNNVNVSVDENVVLYHVVNDGYEEWIITDFDKDIMTIKLATGSGVFCYVTPLNTSMMADPQMLSAMPTKNDTLSSKKFDFTAISNSIKDISFLGRRASTMCYNVPTQWIVPAKDTEGVHHLSKRACCAIYIIIIFPCLRCIVIIGG